MPEMSICDSTMKNQIIIPPEFGWQERTYYLVEVCFNENNPRFGAIFYTGFLENGKPGNYNNIVSCNGDSGGNTISNVVFMRALRILITEKELAGPNKGKCPYNKEIPFDLTPINIMAIDIWLNPVFKGPGDAFKPNKTYSDGFLEYHKTLPPRDPNEPKWEEEINDWWM